MEESFFVFEQTLVNSKEKDWQLEINGSLSGVENVRLKGRKCKSLTGCNGP